MKYRLIGNKDLKSVHELWNDFASETDNVLKTMSEEDAFGKFVFHDDYTIYSIGAFLDHQLIGFSSGTYQKDADTGFITCVVVKKGFRRQEIGQVLLQKLEESMNDDTIVKFDIVFFNPVRLEWMIPGTDSCDHPGTPGVDIESYSYRFFNRCGYQDYVYQNTYFKEIKDFEFTDTIIEKINKLNENGISIEYYDSKKHFGFDSLFDDLKSEGWRKAIQFNLDKDQPDPVLIVHRDGEICGFTGPLRKQESLRGYFAGIGIHSNCRGLGAGRVLFASLCKGLKELGAEYMTFFTGENNPARKIYEKEGFRIVRTWANMRKVVNEKR